MVSTIPSTSKTNLYNTKLQNFNSDDAIFSPYLNKNQGTSQKLSPFIRRDSFQHHHGEKKKEEDGEIGVFGAEKYFNDGEVDSSSVASSSIATSKYLHQHRDHHQIAQESYGTPSIRSESTCNSQSALLHSAMMMRNSQRNNKNKNMNNNKALAKSFLAGIGIKCSCSDKNSVEINDHAGEISFSKTAIYDVYLGKTVPRKILNSGADSDTHSPKISKPVEKFIGVGLNKDFPFSPVSSSSGLGNHFVKMQIQSSQAQEEGEEGEEEEEPRKSLAVFGSPILSHKSKSSSFDKKLRIPKRMEDIIDHHKHNHLGANSGSNFNDAASDASSDLFEIESIKGNNSFLARQATSGCGSPTGYAPSEASIEWSVVTASAAVMSDCDEQMSEVTVRSPIRVPVAASSSRRETQRRRSHGMLLGGCKSHKAVRVAGDAFITYEKPNSNVNSPQSRHHRISNSSSHSQLARFQKESSKVARHAYAATPPSQLLYK
ncbi:hypothetical protein HN51_037739 [Arachis hypogaea]|uniref:Protein PHYTOCHROME KINASE SUBSTRATE n=1 Tax=Arachis hypogaea TaxID=3818 RepID=A0A444ZUN4_ARAHY|nr:protein PHYTOCHROME KINASE SUBSTRATE 1-like [Arachis hypogaea]QHO03344.1 Protein PHYTOCHROME KINASE SUBSTRATE [Arachis hypogaea]RYR17899.1 hypothetical protein Ahy_B03g062567 [Arachis hypogaea]